VQLGIHVANALDIEIPATTVTAGVMYGALNQGCGELDYSALYKVYEPLVKRPPTSLPSPTPKLDDLEAGRENRGLSRTARVDRPDEPVKHIEIPRMTDVLPKSEEAAKPVSLGEVVTPPRETPPSEATTSKVVELTKIDPIKMEPRGEIPAHDAKPESVAIAKGSSIQAIPTELVAESTDTSAAKPITGTETKTGPNGTDEDASPRPFNFVRRWFVSRGS